MRNSNTKVRCEKLSLSKCPGVCRTYSDIQLAYAQQLQADENIAEFRCNVPLGNFERTDGAYTTDFVRTTITGEVIVRECIKRTLIERPKTIKMLDASREYWAQRGVNDLGLAMNMEGLGTLYKKYWR